MRNERDAPAPRLAYLVRCWLVETEHGPVWRATAEGLYGAERRTFADLRAFFDFMIEKTEAHTRETTQSAE